MTIYALISALEEDLRCILKDHIQNQADINNDELLSRSKSRLDKDFGFDYKDPTIFDLIDYFDIGDTLQSINKNKEKLPLQISDSLKRFNRDFEVAIPIRNRVMHIRPLNFDDLPIISNLCEGLLNDNKSIWLNIESAIERISRNPSSVLSLDIRCYEDDTFINHNLPLPDFDETGLIGRDKEIEQIKKLCFSAFPVISIVGEGGVGKSALALKVAYELLDDNKCPFDAIVWVSSKTTQITVNEIKEIKGAIKDSIGVIQEISEQIVGQENNTYNLDEITEYLGTFKILLIIDNLETILDDNIKNFVASLPTGSKILITSRIGLGAYEYPIKLQGIDEHSGSQLLRTLAKIRNVPNLAQLDEKVLRTYVTRMHRNPSYIKWFVSSVQTGLGPELVLQNSSLFLEFCMSNVYQYLSSDAQSLTLAFQCAPGLKDIPELSYLTDFDSLRTQKAIQELMTTNMLSQSSKAKGASVKTTYQLSELARSYLGKHHKPSQAFQKNIREKRNKLNSLFEQQLSSRTNNRYLTTNINFRDKSDRVIAKLLHDSLKNIKSAKHDEAYEILQEAHRLSPDYFEVARVMAYLYQKIGNLTDAREQYELAIVLAPDAPQLHYWFGRFILHEEENVDEAVIHFEKAYKMDGESTDIMLALSRAYMFQHRFDDAKDLLNELSKSIDINDEHNYKIYLDADIQINYRLADEYASKNDFSNSIIHLNKMRALFDDLPYNFKDRYMRQKLGKAKFTLGKILKNFANTLPSELQSFQDWFELEADFS